MKTRCLPLALLRFLRIIIIQTFVQNVYSQNETNPTPKLNVWWCFIIDAALFKDADEIVVPVFPNWYVSPAQ